MTELDRKKHHHALINGEYAAYKNNYDFIMHLIGFLRKWCDDNFMAQNYRGVYSIAKNEDDSDDEEDESNEESNESKPDEIKRIENHITIKGVRVDLTKDNPDLNKLIVDIGWSVNTSNHHDFEIEAVALLVNSQDRCNSDDDMVFFNHKNHKSGAVIHLGKMSEDNAQIEILLNIIPENVSKVVIAVAIYNGTERKQNLAQVNNLSVSIVDENAKNELLCYDIQEDLSQKTGVIAGEIYRHNNNWKFAAKGIGLDDGLNSICKSFGLLS